MTTRRNWWPCTAALGAALVASGCAQQQAAPAPPPAPTALTISAQKGQSQSQQNADKAQCQSQASQFGLPELMQVGGTLGAAYLGRPTVPGGGG